MEPPVGYAVAGVVYLCILMLVCFWNRYRIKPVTDRILHLYQRLWKYLQYTVILPSHSWFGPWAAAEVLSLLGYASANVICILYPSVSAAGLCQQIGMATLINMTFLYCGFNTDLIAEMIGITPKAWYRLHLVITWMVGLLATLHAICVLSKGIATSSSRSSYTGSILAYSTMLWLLLASLSPLKSLHRRLASKFPWLATKLHLLLALTAVVGTYIHVIAEIGTSWIIFVAPVCVLLVLLRDTWHFLYYNGIFGFQGWTRVSFIRLADSTTQINVFPGRPVNIYPGQYINLWIPFPGQFSKSHFRQYHVQSWASTAQQRIKLFDLPDGPISSNPQVKQMQHINENGFRLAFFSGPYGLHHKYTQYETLLVVIYDYGILSVNAQLQYIHECIENRTSKARRVRLVWQWREISETVYDIPETAALKRKIDSELDEFSKKINLRRNLVEYHLGRYVPKHNERSPDEGQPTQDVQLNQIETEIKNLESDARQHIVYDEKKDSESIKIQKEELKRRFDSFQKQIDPLESRIGELAAKRRILDDVLRWMNLTLLRRNHDGFTVQCSIYREDADTTYEFGRAEMIRGTADIRSLYDQEITKHRERITGDLVENRGKFLLMVSSPPAVHELARRVAGARVDEVDLKEFQYVPGRLF